MEIISGRVMPLYVILRRNIRLCFFRYLRRNEDVFENVDSSHAGVMGIYGYAGYTTILATLENQIACGVAIDPVTDWSLYSKHINE